MTAQLPTPGGDAGTWGNILNEFLLVSHNSDGTLQGSAITEAGGLTSSQVGAASGVASLNGSGQVPIAQLGSGTGSTSNYLRGDGTWAVPSGSGGGINPPAGDLGGSTTTPTVVSTHLTTALPVAQGGTGQSTQQAAIDALAGSVTAGTYLRGNGDNVTMSAIQAADVPTLNQNTTGNAATATNLAGGATVPAYLAPQVITLTDGTTVALNAAQGNVFDWSIGANGNELSVPSNSVNGQVITIRITYVGAYTPAFASATGGFSFGTDGAPTWTATSGQLDLVAFEYASAISAWCCVGWKLGY